MALKRLAAAALVIVAVLQPGDNFMPGRRVLLDAHNSYPESGRWADRIDRALATETPLAIEQDLHLRRSPSGEVEVIVAHDDTALAGAPTLDAYFFEKIRPVMEQALKDKRSANWPLITLNLDFKSNDRPLLDAVWEILGRHEAWLTTAPRTETPDKAAALKVGPLLVLTGASPAQRIRFHDVVPVGGRLRAFGAIELPSPQGATREERELSSVTVGPETLMAARAGNYARWVNFPWNVVEQGGQRNAGAWTTGDSTRLTQLVDRAHEQALWIRFYTLDGFTAAENRGFTASYNFGSDSAAMLRWKASIRTGVDFIATDQYEQFIDARTQVRGRRRPQ